jgi:hypothetical protein
VSAATAATVPLYNAYGMRIGNISVSDATQLHGTDLELRARGHGRRRYFTSAKLYARTSIKWAPAYSGGFIVMQLISE